METISITLPKSKRIATVYLDRKKMKTCRFKSLSGPENSDVSSSFRTQ